MSIDVIILTYKPNHLFLACMDALMKQSLPPQKIIVANTEKSYFEDLLTEDDFLAKYDNSVIFHVEEDKFDHGQTRNLAVTYSTADCFVMMTQDAVPADEFLLENLGKGLQETEKTAVCYGRQLATPESDELEKFIRSFNYGDEPLCKTINDVPKLGIKAYFCSNVCAIYERRIFDEVGGFVERAIFNEDMLYAAKVMQKGYAVRYEPTAAVYHSHSYSNRQQFQRNFDNGVSHAEHPEVFAALAPESEGRRMITGAMIHLLKKGKPWLIAKLISQSLAKYRGFRKGRNYRKLGRKQILRYTANPRYWQ